MYTTICKLTPHAHAPEVNYMETMGNYVGMYS